MKDMYDSVINCPQLKCILNLHLICIKKVLIGHYIWCLFLYLVLKFLTKFIPNSTNKRDCISFINFDAKLALKCIKVYLGKWLKKGNNASFFILMIRKIEKIMNSTANQHQINAIPFFFNPSQQNETIDISCENIFFFTLHIFWALRK